MQPTSPPQTLVEDLYKHLMRRPPGPIELEKWESDLARGVPFEDIFYAMVRSKEFRRRTRVKTVHPPGHYYSPVVDPATVVEHVKAARSLGPDDILGIDLPSASMLAFWEQNIDFIQASSIAMEPTPGKRYSYSGGPFPQGDGITLRAMIKAHRPRRIIEIGSGSSTACILDATDEVGLTDCAITCIEPYPDRLLKALWPQDRERIELIESGVQSVPLSTFESIGRGDILFIDSTHVLKTGSDVHFELFEILPRLKSGALVHFHDCQFPFEYPNKWIFDLNRSWNEIYALRAFLMYNERFKVVFWTSLFAKLYKDIIERTYPTFLANPGGSLWLEVQ